MGHSAPPDDSPEMPSDYHVFATDTLGDHETRVLKHNELFGVFDGTGDLPNRGRRDVYGLYLADMRHLSGLRLRIGGQDPLPLSSHVERDRPVLSVHMTNPDMELDGGTKLGSDTLHITRQKVMNEGCCCEQIAVANYGQEPVDLDVRLDFAADFADIFEVRGMHREQWGEVDAERLDERRVRHVYDSLDGVERRTTICFEPAPDTLDERTARYRRTLAPGEPVRFEIMIECWRGEGGRPPIGERGDSLPGQGFEAIVAARRHEPGEEAGTCRLSSSNPIFDAWIGRAYADLEMLTTQTAHGAYPYAGTPWYSTIFGRDGIITALEYLWLSPPLAAGVLEVLAHYQADGRDDRRDAEPGKIVHEVRLGEMAMRGEVPFRCYYGTVDATPLYVLLAGAYFKRTDDQSMMRKIWPTIERAIGWIDDYGDRDGDGFVEYGKRTAQGLDQQGWKDSHDSIFHADGSDAQPPIALAEVQGYVYGARLAAAEVADALGHHGFADRQRQAARELQERFEESFWLEDLGTYAIALDGQNRPCRVKSSNAGQALATGIASPERARRVIDQLMGPSFHTGWGIRTLARDQPRYNPISYHNGSVWPHDNAMIARGFARYGATAEAAQILERLFAAGNHFDNMRMPELFCGFERRPAQGPVRYPVACIPQAWAAAMPFGALEAALGIEIDAGSRRVTFRQPELPESVREIRLHKLSIGDAWVDVILRQHQRDVGLELIDRDGDVELHVVR